jgi:tRNA pseudouridine38-40 synthase
VTLTSKLLLQYDGGPFAGWAAQPGERTIQAEVEAALSRILGAETPVTVAGRTDAGVHAWGQVASYDEEALDPVSLNALLPATIAVLDCAPAADGFDARRDALSRTYCYRLLHRRTRDAFERGRALWWRHDLDRDALRACADALPGPHDFTAFTPAETKHVRFERDVRRAEWVDHGDLLEFWIEADAFMRHMNRILIGTMLEVAAGRRGADDFARLLDGADRRHAGPTAPPHGLYFASVSYPHHS